MRVFQLMFWLSGAFMLYTFLGYPILLGWLGMRFSKPYFRGKVNARVSFIIAVHNGAEYLPRKLSSVLSLDWPADSVEAIVVSDGSTDDTTIVASRLAASDSRIRLIEKQHAGKAAAVNVGVRAATGDILVM